MTVLFLVHAVVVVVCVCVCVLRARGADPSKSSDWKEYQFK